MYHLSVQKAQILQSLPIFYNARIRNIQPNPVSFYYNNNQWCSVVYRVLDQRRSFWHTNEKFRNTNRSWVFLIFLEGVKITSVGLKLDRLQLQHWLLFLEHNRLRSEDLQKCFCRPTCTYGLWLCLWFSLKLSQSFRFWVMQAPVQVLVEFE